MLNRTHSQASNLYGKLQQKLVNETRTLPAEMTTRIHWIMARFARWCALHAAGGGWMCDYDVVNKKFTPDVAEKIESENTLYVNSGNPAFLFYATKEHAGNAIKKFISDPLVKDKKLIDECKILGIKGKAKAESPYLLHAKVKDGLCKSGVMKNACE